MVGNNRYYYYDDVYYVDSPTGYIVVPEPVTTTRVVAVQPAATVVSNVPGEVIVVNVPNSNGSFTPVKMTKRNDGYVGPQGEYYASHPTVAQLKVLYGN